jgi:hypothetical protein
MVCFFSRVRADLGVFYQVAPNTVVRSARLDETWNMDRDIYLIEPLDHGWVLHLNGEELAAFDDEGRAARAAIAAARISERRGRSAEILTADETGTLCPFPMALT